MFKSYFKSAWRNLLRNRAFGLINISGLALGVASSLVILLWVVDEKGIDAFHENNDNLYIVFQRQYHDGIIDGSHATPGLLADELKRTYPDVKLATATAWSRLVTFEAGNKVLKETGTFASPDFFSVFSFPLLAGTKENALKSPVDIAVSRKMAEDFFGSIEAAYGQSIRYENTKDLKITAVFENLPSNTSMEFDYLLNWETFLEENNWARNWGNNGPTTYVVLQQGADSKEFESKFQTFMDRHEGAQSENFKVKLGIQKGKKIVWHYGLWTGISSLIIKVPDQKLTFVILANSPMLSEPYPLAAGDLMKSPFAREFMKSFVLTGALL